MAHYDFFIAGRWRNKDNISPVVDAVRAAGKTAYCFIENAYEGEKIEFKIEDDPEAFMAELEKLSHDDALTRKIFERDMTGQHESDTFLLVLPAGNSGHIEAGVAYGLGKKCYAIGVPDKNETLYRVFEQIFPDIDALQQWLKEQHATNK